MTDFYLAYHGSSRTYADNIATRLERSNYEIKHIPILGEAGPYLSEQLATLKKPIILLVSDNLLKSTIGMHDALNVLKSLIKDELIFPIVVPGVYGSASGNGTVETNISKVGDVINYMNYWRDIFLSARKTKRNFLNGDKDLQAKKLQELRSISAETGEYLRLLRDIEYIRYEDIIDSDFELLYNFLSKQQYTEVKHEAIAADSNLDVEVAPNAPTVTETVVETGPSEKVIQIIRHKSEQSSTSKLSEKDGFVEVADLEIDLSDSFDGEMISDKPLTDVVKPLDIAQSANQDSSEEKAVEETETESTSTHYDHTGQIINDSKSIFESKQYEAGFAFLEDYLKYNPSNIEVRMHLANMRYDFGDKNIAADDVRYILKLDEENIQAHLWIAEYNEITGNYNSALHHLLTVQKFGSEDPEIDFKIGLILKNRMKDAKSARKYFETAISKNPDHKKSLFQLGLLSKAEGDNDQSQDLLRKSLDQQGQKSESDVELARIFAKSGNLEKAKHHYEKAKSQDPNMVDPEIEKYLSRIRSKAKQKKKWEAIKAVKTKSDIASSGKSKDIIIDDKEQTYRYQDKRKKVKVKTILITGATSGIGLATVKELAKRGHRLIITGRRGSRLNRIADHIKTSYKSKIKTLQFDVRDYNDARSALNSLPKKWNRIDVLINNAGLALGKEPIHKAHLKDWDVMIDTNIKGILHMTRLVAPQMAKSRKGQIINICSTAGHEVYPGGSVYCASKSAVDALTKGMRLDLHQYNIRVGQVSPGAVEETEFAKVRFHGDEKRARIYKDFTPTNSKDIAKIIRFMISRPKWVNIQDVLVMGTQQASNMVFNRSGRID